MYSVALEDANNTYTLQSFSFIVEARVCLL